jgi:hypothetical protein
MVVCAFKYIWDFPIRYYESIQCSNSAVEDIGDTAKIYKQRFRQMCVTYGSDFKGGASDSST